MSNGGRATQKFNNLSTFTYAYTRGIQKVLRQILKNTLFMKFTKLFFYIVSIQFITHSDVSIEKFQDGIFRWKHRLQKCYGLVENYVEK